MALPAAHPAVEAAVAPLHAELRQLRSLVEELVRRSPPRLGTLAEAAELLGVHRDTAHKMWRRGEIQGRRIGRAVRVDLAALRPATDDELADAMARGGRR